MFVFKRLLFIICSSVVVFANPNDQLTLMNSASNQTKALVGLKVWHNASQRSFLVEDDSGEKVMVLPQNLDADLRNVDITSIKDFQNNKYLQISKVGPREYSLSSHNRCVGGGPVGATVGALGGATAVQLTYNGMLTALTAGLSPILTPIGAGSVVGTIRFYTLPTATYLTKVAAVAGGIALGSLTGPV